MYKGPREHLRQVVEAQSWEELNLWVTWLPILGFGRSSHNLWFFQERKDRKDWQVKTFVMTAIDHEALIDQLLWA